MKQNKIPRNEYIRKPVGKTNPYKHDVLYTNLGQWKYPGQITRIPSNDITMQGVPYPVYGEDDLGYGQMMYPGMDYTFPGQYVTEIPMAQKGKQVEDKDSWLENIAEIVDPTGVSSWDDVYRAYQNTGLSGETAKEILGAIPLLGKVGKLAKAYSYLAKTPRQAAAINRFNNAMQLGTISGRGSDAFQAALGAKDNSGFTWDMRHGDVPKFGGRNIFPQIELGEHGDYAYGGIPMAQKGYNIVPNVEYVKGMGSQYDPILETIYIDSEDPEDPEKLLQHEMWHHYQNYNNYLRLPEDFPTRKRPQTPSTDEVFQEYYNRKKDDVEQISRGFRERYPEFKFVPNHVLYDRAINGIQYDQPWTMEGEGRAAESPEGIEFLRDQGYDIDQYREMLEKAKNKKAYGGDPSLPNITGHYQKGGGLTYEQWKKKYKLVESPDYNLKRAWELGYTPDAKGHLPTVDEETGVFLKTRNHPTLRKELDWYNSPAGEDFRNQNDIDSSGTYFKYIPKNKDILKTGGWLDEYQPGGRVMPSETTQSQVPAYMKSLPKSLKEAQKKETNKKEREDKIIDEIKKTGKIPKNAPENIKLYYTVEPTSYTDYKNIKRLISDESRNVQKSTMYPADEDAWKKYLGLLNESENIKRSKEKPSKAKSEYNQYYKLNDDLEKQYFKDIMQKLEKSKDTNIVTNEFDIQKQTKDTNPYSVLGNFTIGKGKDPLTNKTYVSYYDKYDFNSAPWFMKDKLESVGKPFEFYNRFYPPEYINEIGDTLRFGENDTYMEYFLDDYYNSKLPNKRRGGLYTPPKIKRKAKKYGTSKNIQSSINKLFTRNYDVFGPGGKNIYNPKAYKTGGWLDFVD